MGQVNIDYAQIEQLTTRLGSMHIIDGDGISAVNDSSLAKLEACTTRVSSTSDQLSSTVSHYDQFLMNLAAEFKKQEKVLTQQFEAIPTASKSGSSRVASSSRGTASDAFFAI
ncbi:hypothetical protein ACEE42_04705 [Streptococcus suis]